MRSFVIKNSGSSEEADDVIQDAIIVFYEKVKRNEFELQTTIKSYIFTVGKYIWYSKLRNHKSQTAHQLQVEKLPLSEFVSTDFELFTVNKTSLVNELFHLMGEGCKKILIESLYMNLPMREIAKRNNLKNEQVARNKKNKCLKSLRDKVNKIPYFKGIVNYLDI